MSIEQSFRDYMATFDGTKKEFSRVKSLFDDLYHEDFVAEMGEKTTTREQLSHHQSNILSIGTKATVKSFEHISGSEIVYKINLVNEQTDVELHIRVTLKEGKFVRARQVDQDHTVSLKKLCALSIGVSLKNKFETYMAVLDGEVKEFSEIEIAVEDLYHDEFINVLDGSKSVNKTQLRGAMTGFLSQGGRAELSLFEHIDDSHFEIKMHMKSEQMDILGHSVVTIKDDRAVRVEPYEDAKEWVETLRTTVYPNQKLTDNISEYSNDYVVVSGQ